MHSTLTLNGQRATADDLRLLVANNYGHFTAMRVADGGVRGLDLHLQRLAQATRELFASELDTAQVRAWLRDAVKDAQGELSVRINVFSRRFDRAHPAAPVPADVLISVTPAPAPAARGMLRLKSFRYTRELPHIKHVGTFPLFHFRALAQRAGFDDALFAAADSTISEASIWNIGFVAGNDDSPQIVWPQAAQLDGIGMQLLQAGCAKLGIASRREALKLGDAGRFRAAFVTNSSAAVAPVAAIDDTVFAWSETLAALLARCHDSNPVNFP